MEKVKKGLAFLIMLCMAMELLLPGSVQKVQADEKSGDYEYIVLDAQNETVQICRYTGTDEKVTIPEMIDGKRVVEIGANAFEKHTKLKEITIPNSVISIGNYAFNTCVHLKEVNIPSSVTSIGSNAFSLCVNMKKVMIQNGVTSIGTNAFYYCAELEEITIPASVVSMGNSAFEGCTDLSEIIYSGKEEQWKELVESTTGNEVLQYAQKDYTGHYEYKILDDGTIEITKYVASDSNTVADISEKINGLSVTSIGANAFEGRSGLEEISIPESVTNIGISAFSGCTSLNSIHYFSNNIMSIGDNAFQGCVGLEEFYIPDGVMSIGNYTFSGCTKLEGITIPESVTSIKENAFDGCTGLSYVQYYGTKEQWGQIEIGAGNDFLTKARIYYTDSTDDMPGDYKYSTFDDGTIEITGYIGEETELEIPGQIDGKKVSSIGESAFEYCYDLESVVIPEGVAKIGDYAFHGCRNLSDISIPEGVVSIEDSAFNSCESLENITLPDSLQSIGSEVFRYCDSLTNIIIPLNVASIGELAFNGCESLSTLKVDERNSSYFCEDGLLINKDKTAVSFCLMGKAGEIKIPEGVTSIEDWAFADCDKITHVALPESVKSIGACAFGWCSMTSITMPDKMESIGSSAFEDCEAITNIKIPNGIKDIEDETFSGCDKLKSIQIPESVSKIGRFAFSGCENLENVVLPEGVSSIDRGAFYGCSSLRNITIPKSLTTIGYTVFSSCTGLTNMVIPNTVKNIENYAFAGCMGLTDIRIPNGTIVGNRAFYGCENLKSIDVSKDNSLYLSEKGILYNKNKTVLLICPEGKKGSVLIPDGVLSIVDTAFEGCSGVTSIAFPVSIANTGYYTFFNCSGIKDVYYAGSKSQWDEIEMDDRMFDMPNGNENILNANFHYNTYPSSEPDVPIPDIPTHPDEPQIEDLISAKQALESLKAGDALSLEPAFQPYLSTGQIDIMESYLYTWLAEINYAYKYSGSNNTKERIMKKAGIDPDGNFSSGAEQAITHITVDTKYGKKTFEITLNLGKSDGNGNLYPAYGAMHYELLQKENVPSDVPKTGQIGKSDYTDLGTFAQCVSKAAEDSLHATYQWQSLSDEMTSGVLVDKTVTEIIGNKNGSFSDGTFTIYEKPLFAYSKKVTIACPVDVRVFTMDGKDAGSIVNNEITKKDNNVRLQVEGDTKTVYLSGNDYYLNLRGTDTGKMSYKVEELATLEEAANEEVRRTVQFLELQLKKDLQYEGYVFRPLNIDSDLYALRMIDGSNKETILPKEDTYKSIFKKVQELSLSYGGAATIDQNKSVQLNARLTPQDASNQSLKWTTDNQSVLSVDENGLVTAVGAGSATVTVSTKDGSFLKQYCVINVKGGSGNSGGTGGTGNSGSSGNTGSSGNGANGSGGSGNNSDNSGNNADDSKPSLEPETPPVVVALHYVLQFQTNGGINLSRKTMTLLADDNPGIMPKIQRKGYVFDGWYTQQYGGEQVTGDQPLKAAATLYAHWSKAKAPKKVSAPTLKSKKKGQMKVAFKKVKGAAGYQLQYSAKKGFASKKTKQFGASAKAKTISGLKAGKEYYARVRAYSTDSMGNKLYGKYSKVKGVKIHP